MEWLIGYLVSVIVVPTLFGAFTIDGSNKLIVEDSVEVFSFAGLCLIWPITLSFIAVQGAMKVREEYVEDKIERLLSRNNLRTYKEFDRDALIKASERDLKYLLKKARKNKTNLEPTHIHMLREELMNRNAERNLMS